MKKSVKTRWVNALRSGEYKQGNGFLTTTENGTVKHCCLGVLCDLAAKDGIVTPTEISIGDDSRNKVLYVTPDGPAGAGFWLPRAVAKWAGLSLRQHANFGMTDDEEKTIDPKVTIDGENIGLSQLNDQGKPFSVIADVIEQQL